MTEYRERTARPDPSVFEVAQRSERSAAEAATSEARPSPQV
jgi:hypothetical protein